MPFVTEELWQRLQWAGEQGGAVAPRPGRALATAAWPGSARSDQCGTLPLGAAHNPAVERTMQSVLGTAAAARSAAQTAREVSGMGPRDVRYEISTPPEVHFNAAAVHALELLLKCAPGEGRVVLQSSGTAAGISSATDTGVTVTVPFPATASARDKLLAAAKKRDAKAGKVQKKLQALTKRLESAKFTASAPPAVVQEAKKEAEDMQLQLQALDSAAAELRAAAAKCV